jgi:ribonuclease HI
MVIAATDGSALGNPGPGGWAWVTEDGQIGFGSEGHATNNQMELRAVLELLRSVDPAETLTIQADSEYAVNIFTVWLPGWRERGMRTSAGSAAEASLLNHAERSSGNSAANRGDGGVVVANGGPASPAMRNTAAKRPTATAGTG